MGKSLNEKQLKEQYFEGLFEERVKRYETETNGKFVDVVMVCNNKSLEVFFNRLYKKYKVKHSYNDFMNECIHWSYFAIQRFHIRDEGSWEEMMEGTDKANIGRLVNNIKTTVENEIIRFVNDGVKFTRGEVDGEKGQHMKIKVNFSSLDAVLMGADGDTTTLVNMVSDEQGFWGVNGNYKMNHFMEWFKENRQRVLTKSQNQLLDNLSKCSHEKDGYTENDLEEYIGFNPRKISYYMDRIKNRTLKAWEKENPLGEKTQLEMMREKEIKLWTELMELVYVDEDEVAGQNKAISDWIIANFDNEKVSNIIYDNMSQEECIAVVHAYHTKGEQTAIPSKVIYKFVSFVEDRLNYLQVMDTSSTKIKPNPENKKKNIERANYRKQFIEQPCYVYDKEGNLLRIEAWKPYKAKKNDVKEILPTGIEVVEE